MLLGACLVLGACAERAAPAKAGPDRPNASMAHHATPPASWRPDQDLGPEQFHERVDGAATALLSLGCRRLLYFRRDSPPADLELLVFATADGARAALSRDAGDARSQGLPGDEAWANEQCVFFRRGRIYVRLIADDAAHEGAVRAEAERVARAMARGELPR